MAVDAHYRGDLAVAPRRQVGRVLRRQGLGRINGRRLSPTCIRLCQLDGSQYVERTGGQETKAWNKSNTGSAAGTPASPIPVARARKGTLGIRKRVPTLR